MNARDVLLAASPEAGGTDGAALSAAARVLGLTTEVDTSGDLDAVLDRLDGRLLVTAGGDGSLHLLLSRLRERGLDIPVGLVPLGTGNDFARTLGLPLDDPAAAARQVLTGVPRRLDLLLSDVGPVVNVVHLGVGAVAADFAAGLKDRLGPLAYPLGATRAGATSRGWWVSAEIDGRVLHDGPALMVGVGNGRSIGGGTPLLPRADPADGRLDVMVSAAVGPLERVRFALALRRGQHLDDPAVVAGRGESVRVTATKPIPVNADGELGEAVTHRTWQVLPAAWTVVC